MYRTYTVVGAVLIINVSDRTADVVDVVSVNM
jgi:hypothetical protein